MLRAFCTAILLTAACIGAVAFPTQSPSAQDLVEEPDIGDFSGEVLIKADELTYDEALGTVVATGNVEIAQGERLLIADTVSYNQSAKLVTASGNVTLMEPTGEVMFADYAEITDDLRDGIIHNLRILMTDHSRIAANGARRTNGNRTEMRKAVYSPCELCEEDREAAPIWQLKAIKIVHDQVARDIEYYDAWFELYGYPVAYVPYFRHPDPTVKRRSGFLTPSYANSTALGFEVTTPYYWSIAPHRDVTIAPRFTTDEGVILGAEYREHTGNGQYLVDGSITYTDARDDDGKLEGGNEVRAHLFSDGRFDLDEEWRWGYDFQRASDDLYLRRYRISSLDTLTTNVFVEGFNGRSYAAGNTYWFQGLKDGDDEGQIPLVLPLLDFNFVGEPDTNGGYFTLNTNAMVLQRLEGTDSRRLSAEAGWHLPYITESGHAFRLSATMRGDVYHVNNVVDPNDPDGEKDRGLTGRVRPELTAEWRYPLVSHIGTIRHVLEPIIQVVVAPNGGNPAIIPNEDSQDFEFDHTNLFTNNRFTGLDRVESGPRANYGLRFGFYGQGGGRTTVLVGQSARLREDDTFDQGSGLEEHLSDYVGRVYIQPSDFLNLSYRFRYDNDDLSARRNEVDLTTGPDWLRAAIGYALIEDQQANGGTTTFANREEVVGSLALKFADYWTATTGMRRDLTGDGATINWDAGLSYQDECVLVSTVLQRSFTRDREIEPQTDFIFFIKLKNLG